MKRLFQRLAIDRNGEERNKGRVLQLVSSGILMKI